MKRLRHRLILILAASLLAVIPLLLTVQPAPPLFLTPPNPNGYEQLLALAKSLRTNASPALLADLERALAFPAEAPPRHYDMYQHPSLELVHIGNLAEELHALSRHAEEAGNWPRAAMLYLATARLGEKIERGPAQSFFFGAGIQAVALNSLEKILLNLTSEERSEISRALARLASNRLPMGAIAERQEYFDSVNPPHFFRRLRWRLDPGVRKQRARARRQIQTLYHSIQTQYARLIQSISTAAPLTAPTRTQ